MLPPEIQKNVRHNFAVNVTDAGFFGLAALGFASTVTVIPLFLNSLGASAVLIAVVGSIHNIGWQLPQLFTAGHVARLSRFKPTVLFMTIHERWPMFGLAAVALLMHTAHPSLTTALAFIMLIIYFNSCYSNCSPTCWTNLLFRETNGTTGFYR